MKLGKVIGRVVSTRKLACFEGQKLLLVQRVDNDGSEIGVPFVALDVAQAGEGDLVYWEGGREAGETMAHVMNPADAAVMAIVDHLGGCPMIVGKVTGHVVATHKCPDYEGRTVLIVQPLDGRGKPAGKSLLAIDAAQAGVGDTVLIIDEGGSARVVLDTPDIKTIRTVIAGIVDEVTH